MRKRREWETTEDDPTAGLINLFDVWMVFAVALLLSMTSLAVRSTPTGASEAAAVLETLPKPGAKVESVRLTRDQLSGEGQRLGTAYRLKSGEIVYIPETPRSSPD